jgi:hypothetical protein
LANISWNGDPCGETDFEICAIFQKRKEKSISKEMPKLAEASSVSFMPPDASFVQSKCRRFFRDFPSSSALFCSLGYVFKAGVTTGQLALE